MTVRPAKRPLAGFIDSRSEPEIVLGQHLRGLPAVSVNLNGSRSGTRTFTSAREIRALIMELMDGVIYLENQKALEKQS